MVSLMDIQRGLPRNLLAVWNSLTGKRKRYVLERGNNDDLSKKECAKRARLSTAPQIEDDENIVAIITWIQDKNVTPRSDLSAERKKELLAEFAEDENLDVKDRMKAMEQHSKMVGDNAAKQVEVHGQVQHQLEKLSDEDLQKELKQLGMLDSLDFVDTQCSYLPDVDSVALKPTVVDAEIVEELEDQKPLSMDELLS